MWRLLEARMRPVLPELAATAAAGAPLGLLLVVRYDALGETPERVACVFGLAVLLTVSLYRWSMLSIERRESRLTLLVSLPVTLRSVAQIQVFELVAPPAVIAGVALGAGGLGRSAAGGPSEAFPLWLLGIVTCSVLVTDQLVMLADQLRCHRGGRRSSPWLLWGLILIAGVSVAFLFRHPRPILDALEALRPIIVSSVSIAAGLAITATLAVVNYRLFVTRPDFVD